jgi:hypothetical protein
MVDDALVLAFRGEVVSDPKELARHPHYAVGNSKVFRCFSVRFKGEVYPAAVPFPVKTLRALRLTSKSERLLGPLNDLFRKELSAKQPIRDESVRLLESLWQQRWQHPWLVVTINGHGSIGFADPLMRKRVELKAVSAVRKKLKAKGWSVRSVEQECLGYDLHCTKPNGAQLHVEVKGTVASSEGFYLTSGEYKFASKHPKTFRLFVVTSALKNSTVREYGFAKMKSAFKLESIAYKATSTK